LSEKVRVSTAENILLAFSIPMSVCQFYHLELVYNWFVTHNLESHIFIAGFKKPDF